MQWMSLEQWVFHRMCTSVVPLPVRDMPAEHGLIAGRYESRGTASKRRVLIACSRSFVQVVYRPVVRSCERACATILPLARRVRIPTYAEEDAKWQYLHAPRLSPARPAASGLLSLASWPAIPGR